MLVDFALLILSPVSPHEIKAKRFSQDVPGVKKEIVCERDQNGLRPLSPVEKDKPKDIIQLLCFERKLRLTDNICFVRPLSDSGSRTRLQHAPVAREAIRRTDIDARFTLLTRV